MEFKVVYSKNAENQLSELFEYIVEKAGEKIASGFITSIIDYCDSFETFPERGILRDDLRQGLRIVGFRRRVTIAFVVDISQVIILGIYYGGQDFESEIVGE